MSSLKDLASLIMVPSLVKDGRLDTVKPLGNSIIHPDATGNNDGTDGSTPAEGNFTFSRGSNLAATRVDVNGLIEKGRENLALQGSDISTQSGSWVVNQGGVTTQNATTSPIGTNTASQITANGSNTYSGVAQTGIVMGALRYTYSVYLKAQSGTPDIRLTSYDGVTFHQQDFSITTEWERYSITFTPAAGTHSIYITSQQGVSWYAWGAQFELGLVATDYIETGASTAQAGILEDLPRLDYSGGASCPSLLLEPQRTNLFDYSEYIHGWLNAGGTSSQNSPDSTSPEGKYNAAVIDANSVRYRSFSISSSANSYSVYAKAKSGSILGLRIDTPTTKTTNFDLSDGTISSTGSGHTASIEAVGDGWYRCIISFTDSIVNAVLQTTSSGSVYVWGAQLEAGSYPTSYIPTMGSAVTRSEDVCIKTQTFNDIKHNDVTLFYDFDHLGDLPAGQNQFVAYFGSGKYLNIAQYDANVYYVDTDINGSYFFAVAFAATEGRKKVAIKIDGFSWKVFFNGSKIVDTTLTQQSTNAMTEIILSGGTASRPSFQSVHQALAFPTALTDSECIALTTL